MSDRKYRQHGYQDQGDKDRPQQERPSPARSQEMTFGPRTLNMAPTHTVSRCAQCGVILPALGDAVGACPKCGFELHSCRQCAHFDPASRFECRQPVAERVARKDTRNACTLFAIRVAVEKETGSVRVNDARRAFDNLFRK